METLKRLDRTVDYIANLFENGWTYINKLDAINGEGTLLYDEVATIVRQGRRKNLIVGEDNVVTEALQSMLSTWDSGYDTAAAEDLVDDERSIKDVLVEYAQQARHDASISF
jgi:hypothetical protein